jgi:nucleoside-diphosphate-sugar epimerase
MNEDRKNIWIFGATGFIGQALFDYLTENLQNRLFLLLHRRMPFKKFENHNTFTGSLSDFDPRLFGRYPPDVVFHLARFPGGNALTRTLASQRAFKANQRLVEILKNLKKPPVVVYVSGSLMYGPQKNTEPATEQTPLNPAAYAKYYIKGELPWLYAQEQEILDVRFARPGWIVGPSSWFAEFFGKYYLKTGKVPYYGDGSQLMSLVSLRDCARLIARLAEKGTVRQNLNIFTMPPLPQKEFSELLAGKLNAALTGISIQDVRRRYGKTVASALTSCIPLSTLYLDLYRDYQPVTPNLEIVFDEVLSFLENEQGVFAELP